MSETKVFGSLNRRFQKSGFIIWSDFLILDGKFCYINIGAKCIAQYFCGIEDIEAVHPSECQISVF